MTRKIINISIVLLLLTATIGVSVSRHYCGEILVDVAINSHAEDCGMAMDCCTNETQLFAIDDDFQLKIQAIVFHSPEVELVEIGDVIDEGLISFELKIRDKIIPPLLEPDVDIFIEVQSFLL
jgi:hypothetical protein